MFHHQYNPSLPIIHQGTSSALCQWWAIGTSKLQTTQYANGWQMKGWLGYEGRKTRGWGARGEQSIGGSGSLGFKFVFIEDNSQLFFFFWVNFLKLATWKKKVRMDFLEIFLAQMRKKCKIIIFRQWVSSCCQNLIGFLDFSTLLLPMTKFG